MSYHTVLLNSAHRPSGSEIHSFDIPLPNQLKNITGFKIQSGRFFNERLIQKKNNSIVILIETLENTQIESTVTLPNGNYSLQMSSIIQVLNQETSGLQITFEATTDERVLISLQNARQVLLKRSPLLELLGFPSGVLITNSTFPPTLNLATDAYQVYSGIALAPQHYNLETPNDLVLDIHRIDVVQANTSTHHRSSAVFFVNRQASYTFVDSSQNEFSRLQEPVERLLSLRVKVTDANGNPYDFEGRDFCFLLTFECQTL